MKVLVMSEEAFLKKLFKYVINVKKNDAELTAVDAITNFCFENDIEVEYVGSLIHDTEWFKTFVSNDCSYFENDTKVEDW